MTPIWYFVGIRLAVMGVIILVSGIYSVVNPPLKPTVLGNLHPDLWWGGFMFLAGLMFLLLNKNKTVR
jgi:hypothetical protein